jgi:hypothetical protein
MQLAQTNQEKARFKTLALEILVLGTFKCRLIIRRYEIENAH